MLTDLLRFLPHVFYGLTALSFAVRDVVWLRCLSIGASSLQIAYELLKPEGRMVTVTWHSLFIGIHVYRIIRIVLGERAVRFSEDERELHETIFRNFTKLEFMKLLRAGAWKDAEPGTPDAMLSCEGQPLDHVMLIVQGMADVQCTGKTVAQLRDGQLIGEMSFLTGEPASATVTVTQPTRYLAWRKDELKALRTRNPSLRFAMDTVIGTDLSRKLNRV
jgi:hypothetical protein